MLNTAGDQKTRRVLPQTKSLGSNCGYKRKIHKARGWLWNPYQVTKIACKHTQPEIDRLWNLCLFNPGRTTGRMLNMYERLEQNKTNLERHVKLTGFWLWAGIG